MGSNKKNSEVVVDSFSVSCLYPNHVEPDFIPESNDYFALCEICQTPLLPSILIETLVTGTDSGRELHESEAATVLISAIGIYWAQYNLEVKPFIVTGMAREEIFPSPILPDPDVQVRQAELAEVLESLSGFEHAEYGSLEEHDWWFLFARDMLTWQVMSHEETGKEELQLGIQQKFAVLNAKNFDGFNQLVDRALARMESTGQLITFFRDKLLKSAIVDRIYIPFEVSVSLDTAVWGFCDSQDLPRLTDGSHETQIQVLVRETISLQSPDCMAIALLPMSTTLEIEPVLDYDFDHFGRPETSFEVVGQLVAIEHDLHMKFRAIIPTKLSYYDDPPAFDGSFENFEVYLAHRFDRIHFPPDPWITAAGEELKANFLDDGNDFFAAEQFPVFDVQCVRVSSDALWFKGSPWENPSSQIVS